MRSFLIGLLVFTSSLAFGAFSSNDATVTTAVGSSARVIIPVFNDRSYSVVANVTVNTGGQTFTCSGNPCTAATGGFGLGTQVTLTTTGTLPTGLATATTYYVVPVTTTNFNLATSLANAQAGTVITVTGAGSGTHTITYSTLATGSATLQGSNDGIVWANVPIRATGDATKSATISASGTIMLTDTDMSYKYVGVLYSVSAGQFTAAQISRVKIDQ